MQKTMFTPIIVARRLDTSESEREGECVCVYEGETLCARERECVCEREIVRERERESA